MVNLAKLEKVLGCTVVSSCAVSVDEQTGLIAYPASSTVVLHNPKTNNQAFLVGSAKNSLSCLAFSKCGKYLVTGEFGHDPRVRVWEVYDTNGHFSGVQLAEFLHHEMGIVCVRFALDGEYVVSVGNKHDRRIALWKWKANAKVAENRTTSIVRAMDINEAGTICVTVGVRHVKFWYLDDKKASLQGRSAILADQRNNTFIDVRCGPNNRTFSLTITKLLIEFKDKKLINTYHMHDEAPLALSLGENVLYIGFKNGTIRCMDANTMERKMTYCKPHYLFCDVASGSMNDSLLSSTHPKGSK
ncbi:hypothetical protein AB6A40_004828 [Gnathostoma spinigerum]|uniref:Uncharacterized protein n=1 Tax=Gnathostoma spinigerum TaxID=75299 RepID=A0ABD6EDN8_9BILA